MSYTGDLFCAFRLIVSAYFWRIYGPFIWPFMRVWSDAAQSSFNVTICGVQNIVFPSLYSNVKQDSNMKSHWWLVDSGAGRSMSSNVEDFILYVEFRIIGVRRMYYYVHGPMMREVFFS